MYDQNFMVVYRGGSLWADRLALERLPNGTFLVYGLLFHNSPNTDMIWFWVGCRYRDRCFVRSFKRDFIALRRSFSEVYGAQLHQDYIFSFREKPNYLTS